METFREYCIANKYKFLPIKGGFYGFVLLRNGNIRIDKNSCGEITVSDDRINEVALDLKRLLRNENYFVYNRKKAKNISTLL